MRFAELVGAAIADGSEDPPGLRRFLETQLGKSLLSHELRALRTIDFSTPAPPELYAAIVASMRGLLDTAQIESAVSFNRQTDPDA